MPIRGQAKIPPEPHSSSLVLRTFSWAAFGLGATACLLVFVYMSVSELVLPQTGTYVGEMRPNFQISTVELPANSQLSRVFVKEGDVVKKGDILFQLNYTALTQESERLNRTLLGLRLQRQCLLKWPKNPFTKAELLDRRKSLRNPEDQFVFDAASSECQTEGAGFERGSLSHNETMKKLEKRIYLLKKKLSLLTNSPDLAKATSQSKLSLAYEALSVALAQNITELTRSTIDDKHAETLKTQKSEKFSRAMEIHGTIENIADTQSLLTNFLAHPEIRAEIDGQVARVRDDQLNGQYAAGVPLIDLRVIEENDFRVTFAIPATEAGNLRIGKLVEIVTIGLSKQSPLLKGHVTDISTTHSAGEIDSLTIEIALNNGSRAILEGSTTGLALHDKQTAATVKVALAPTAFLPDFIGTLHQAFGGITSPFNKIQTFLDQSARHAEFDQNEYLSNFGGL